MYTLNVNSIIHVLYNLQHLVNMGSYNTFMAVIGGITHSSIARLHKTLGHLSADYQKVLQCDTVCY